jgi:ABC-type glycerol-3-phosphate transport system permease component
VVINAGNTDNHVLSLSLQILGGRAAESPNLIFAGVTMAVAVPVAVFVAAQRYFVENVATSGLK